MNGKENHMKSPHSAARRALRVALAAAAVALNAALVAAPATDFKAMLKAVDEMGNFGGQDVSVIYTVVSTKPDEPESVYQWSVFRRDKKKQVVMVFLKPEAQKGQGVLKIDDDVYTYEPDVGFTHSSWSKNIQNSDAKGSDFRGLSYVDDYDIAATGEEKLSKYPVWILTLKAKTSEVSYDWIRLYIRKDKAIVLKEESYSVAAKFENARLLRTTQYPPKYVEAAGKTVPMEIRMVDEVNKGEKTVMTIDKLSVGKLPDSTFSKSFLTRTNKE
jgi:hypothetical protein